MNIIHLILLSQIVFIEGFGLNSSCEVPNPNLPNGETGSSHNSSELLHNLNMKIISENDDSIVTEVNLKLRKRSLANENLPIWMLKGMINSSNLQDIYDSDLVKSNEVMKRLGKFSVFQQPKTSSAAVYFHNRQEFDGVIGYDILIKEFSIDLINPENEINQQIGSDGVHRRARYQRRPDVRSDSLDKYTGVDYQHYKRTHQGRLYDGYPEVLVVVSWDVAENLTKSIADESDTYTAIVSYVITLFNGVDMLYSKLEGTKIQINIAGIIIGTEEISFAFLEGCRYMWIDERSRTVMKKMDANCVNEKIVSYLSVRQRKISRDSYDVVVFLTRQKLFHMKNGGTFDHESEHYKQLDGKAHYQQKIFAYKVLDEEIILATTITDEGNLHNYPTIAHQLGQLMSIKHDDPSFFTNDEKCCENLSETSAEFCNKCLSWSETSEKTLNLFYRSPNCCSFINKPQSLLPAGRHRMLRSDEQCQCYGYKTALKSRESGKHFCYANLLCIGIDGRYYQAALPMDGTPHGDDKKVCWDKKSYPIEHS